MGLHCQSDLGVWCSIPSITCSLDKFKAEAFLKQAGIELIEGPVLVLIIKNVVSPQLFDQLCRQAKSWSHIIIVTGHSFVGESLTGKRSQWNTVSMVIAR